MLLVLKPLAVVSFTVGKGIYTVSFTFSFDVLAFINITILNTVFPLPLGLRPFISPVYTEPSLNV